MVKDPIGDIEKTCRNTSICSFFENLKAMSTKLHPKLMNPSSSVESIESSSEPKYDINTTQHISTRRSKMLYDMREKLLSTHQSCFKCWKIAMTSLFLYICKVNTKHVTTEICMVLDHLPFMFMMLELNSLFVVIVIWFLSLK